MERWNVCKAIDPAEPIQRREDWHKKGGCGCHGRHDCHKEKKEKMIVFLHSKFNFSKQGCDDRDSCDNRDGRLSRSSPVVTRTL